MLKIQEIRELIKLIDESSIDEFEFEQNGSKVTLRKHQGEVTRTVASPAPAPTEEKIHSEPVARTTEPEQKQVTEPAKVSEPSEPDRSGLVSVTSPMVGTFYEAPSPDEAPYVQKGDRVKADTVVCIVEAMKLMNEIEAEANGEIVEILVENGELVEYGQELFLVKPE
ncbi:acetyl-CoA carboxylase biotin carboxyl carrier protein [Salisediminibacterium selenitireducens]|uniref:Biotin carboxyl carrier protein of acetyl-CoA carboxylase n=1 Tax=Bacillus selenitireducens (strain ATCC 700615 / DSM 15326 / MLS10) TaxID=439292 RepID=D6XW23_BACIE|nr:acetyl-CoA carboxylase biotin carboxyl carrier protein [Salisediminibacterium selenitireducens]ADH99777.1 acetyl-CoA carboxylase, biotin carboxyl carrier protein [[Bacillus] selenitireducens MLS10]